MNIFVDENIPRESVDALRAAGHDVLDIRQTPQQGTPDPDLWKMVQAQKRLLGMLIVRLRRPNRAAIHLRVMAAIKQHRAEQWPGLLVVMRDRIKSVRRSRAPAP
jgi:hypothetical protein